MKKTLLLALSCALTNGCASGGASISQMGRPTERVSVTDASGFTESFELTPSVSARNSVVPARPTEVWLVLPSVFEMLQIETSVVDPGSLVIGNPRSRPRRIERKRLSTYLDCGSGLIGPRADSYQVTLQMDGSARIRSEREHISDNVHGRLREATRREWE